jgi:hypothetical protein
LRVFQNRIMGGDVMETWEKRNENVINSF